MKTVIVEIKKNNAAALTDDGCVIKVKDRNYAIGEVIKVGKLQKINKPKFAIIATCAAALAIVFGISTWVYFTPYTYVSLDVNPSVEFEVNRFDRVLSVTAVNDDGSEILQDIDVNNMTIDEALKTTVNEIEQEGYFDGQDPGGIMISTSSENEEQAQSLAKELENTAEEVITDNGESIEIEAVSVGLQRVREAHALGTTPGKLNLVKEMQNCLDEPSDIDFDEWLNKPVQDIMREIKKNKEIDEADVPKNKKSIDKNALIHKKSLLSDKKILNDKKQKFSNQQTANKHRRIKKSNKKYKNNKAKLNFSNKEVSKKNIDKNKKRPRSHQKESKAIKKQQEKILKRE